MTEELTPEEKAALEKKLKHIKIPYHVVAKADGVLTDEERKNLLLSLKSIFAYTGIMLPTKIRLEDGTKVKLKELVWGLFSKKELTDEEVVAARQLAAMLEKGAERNQDLIDKYEITEEQAEKLYFLTAGMLRAVMELRGLGMKDRESEYAQIAKERRIDDAKKLLAFFKEVKI